MNAPATPSTPNRNQAGLDRTEVQVGSLLAAACGLLVIAYFFPLLVFGGANSETRLGIWTTTSFFGGELAGSRSNWFYGVPVTLVAVIALWTALSMIRSQGKPAGWIRRQLLFSSSAGFLIGVCGLLTVLLLSSVSTGGDSGQGTAPGAALFLLGGSVTLTIAALVLNRLGLPTPVAPEQSRPTSRAPQPRPTTAVAEPSTASAETEPDDDEPDEDEAGKDEAGKV